MRRKISVIFIMVIMLSLAVMSCVIADPTDTICKFHASVVPNNPTPGSEVVVEFSTTEINEKISNVSILFNYSKEVFDLSRVDVGDGWSQTNLEDTYLLNNDEGTTEVGKLITFYLNVKETAVPGTETEISLTAIQVATDADPVDFNDLKQTITISSPIQDNPTNETVDNDTNEVTDRK